MKLAIIGNAELFLIDVPKSALSDLPAWAMSQFEELGLSESDCQWGFICLINGGSV